jgi:hypothetical protein
VDNVYFVYNKYGNPLNASCPKPDGAPYSVLIDNETSKISVVRAGKFLVCFVGDENAELSSVDRRVTYC